MTAFGKRIDGVGGRRTEQREPLVVSAAISTREGSAVAVLMDVSRTGAKLTSESPLHEGQDVWIKVHPVDAFGTVVWADGDTFGLTFEEPISDADVEHLRREGEGVSIARLSSDEKLAAEYWQSGFAR